MARRNRREAVEEVPVEKKIWLNLTQKMKIFLRSEMKFAFQVLGVKRYIQQLNFLLQSITACR